MSPKNLFLGQPGRLIIKINTCHQSFGPSQLKHGSPQAEQFPCKPCTEHYVCHQHKHSATNARNCLKSGSHHLLSDRLGTPQCMQHQLLPVDKPLVKR